MGLTVGKYYSQTNNFKFIQLPIYYRGKKYILNNETNLIVYLPSPYEVEIRCIKQANRPYIELYYKQCIKVKVIEEGPVIHFRLINIKEPLQTKEKLIFLLTDTIQAIKLSEGDYELEEEDTTYLYEQCEKY
jgi:hypothetical protein